MSFSSLFFSRIPQYIHDVGMPRISVSGTTNRRLSSPLVSPLPTTPAANSQLHVNRDRNARHSRNTSWSTGRDILSPAIGEFSTTFESTAGSSTTQQRRRRESNYSLASVSERGGGGGNDSDADSDYDYDVDETMALRNTSMDWKGHARRRSQSQGQQDLPVLEPHPSTSVAASPLHPSGPSHSFVSGPPPVSSTARPGPVTWMSLPRKKQLAILGLCRVFDFLQIASLQAYMFYQLKSFDQDLSDSDVSTQAGILQGAFTAAQFATAIPWGRVADAEWGGRKFVLLVGLLGTAVSCLGVAFSTSFAQAVFWRSFGGAINGTVGIIRTSIAENVKEKKYHSRAFLILPIGFNIASLFGPGKFLLPLISGIKFDMLTAD